MGAYLSKPETEKKSLDFTNKRFSYGVSGMQGWRVSMEDAYNCIPDLDADCSLFGVYDGHGGNEVALYCAHHIGEVLKENANFKSDKIEQALSETFMELDRSIILKEAIQELKVLCHKTLEDGPATKEDIQKKAEEELPEENETELLHEEATMSIEELLKRYGQAANAMNTAISHSDEFAVESSSSSVTTSKDKKDDKKNEVDLSEETKCSKEEKEDKTEDKSSKQDADAVSETKEKDESKAKGDSLPETKVKVIQKVKEKVKPAKLCLPDDEYQPPHDSDSESEESFDSSEAVGGSDDESSEEDSEDEEDLTEEKIGSEVTEDDAMNDPSSGVEIPGKDSGTTAVVALLKGNILTVANAGDSRCVLARANGVAFDMSDDHKPEDERELTRITSAGGVVNGQGRVNGGLNLSRAIGDHCYKANEKLDLENQMITAMPDCRTVELSSGDEFMVLACDGIWNVLSSQEVVDFVRKRLSGETENKDFKLSTICEELFSECLAPDTMGDGTGCDNMTCIIVRFNHEGLRKQKQNGSVTHIPVQLNNCEESIKNNNTIDSNNQETVTKYSVKRTSPDENTEVEDKGAIENNSKRIKMA